MASPQTSRRLWILLGSVLALALAGAIGWQLALQRLHAAISESLGPRSSVERIELGLSAVRLIKRRVRGQRGWPAEDELRAGRITVVPHLRSMLGGLGARAWRLHSISVEDGYISLQRSADGRMQLLPALRHDAPAAAPHATV